LFLEFVVVVAMISVVLGHETFELIFVLGLLHGRSEYFGLN